MRTLGLLCLLFVLLAGCADEQAQPEASAVSVEPEWEPLFAPGLASAAYPPGSWTYEDSVLTAHDDVEIWSRETYDDFILDLEFRTGPGSNSGVIIHADTSDWVPNSLEIQIADDFHDMWANAPAHWRAGAIFGHVAPTESTVRVPGEWNRLIITSDDRHITVELNGRVVSEMEMDRWTSADENPDGSEIPEWLSRPVAELPARGHIGLQGTHGEAAVAFRNLRIRRLD